MLLSFGLVLISCITAPETAPLFQDRVLYAPGHFGNYYEVMGENEARDVIAEAKHWGFNRYSDWFDTINCCDPFSDPLVFLAKALWEKKKERFRIAQSAGMPCDLILTPNHVYAEQCTPDVAAIKADRIFGQLVCPSKPKGREIILKDLENLFSDLNKSGIRLSALWACPYDFGGCACEQCKPWILTFAKLCRDIHMIAERYHPGIEMRFIGWWWSEEEHKLFAEWCDREAPGWAKSIALHIPYDAADVSGVVLPKDCQRQAFVHIGYAEESTAMDIYGHLGGICAADRLSRTVNALKARGCTGVMAYSEGVFEDVNKAVLAGLSSGQYASADEILCAYASRYFNADQAAAAKWSEWLKVWGRPFAVDAAAARRTLDELSQGTDKSTWRFQQWDLKTEMMRLNAEIMKESGWETTRLQAVDDFWAVQERLQRGVWGVGVLQAVLCREHTPLPWYKEWAQHQAEMVAPKQ